MKKFINLACSAIVQFLLILKTTWKIPFFMSINRRWLYFSLLLFQIILMKRYDFFGKNKSALKALFPFCFSHFVN